ncbi:MAG TPA: helix-hairpin-helix domain-containing protein [Chryseolinea sp.]
MRIVHLLVYVCLFISTAAQDFPRTDIDPIRLADDLYGVQDQDLNYEELYENLLQLLSRPLDLNKVAAEELRFLKILSEEQITSFLEYRDNNGKLLSIYELQAVPLLDIETILKIAPLVKVKDPASTLDASFWNRVKSEGDNYFMIRYERTLQSPSGFTAEADSVQKFRGSPDKVYLRFRSSTPGDYSAGFTAEKDPGETISWSQRRHYYGFDYLSLHFQIQNKGRLKNLVVGDFQSQFAQGVMLGGAFGTGKGSETILTCRRSNIGLMPYTSVNEAGYLRGVGATVELTPNVDMTAFYSRAKRDANLEADTLSETVVSSFQSSGLHRNVPELTKRKTVVDQNAALVVQYKLRQIDAGLMYNIVNFNVDVERRRTPYNQFAFEGKTQQNVGAYVNCTFQNVAFFSEFARSLKKGTALTAGILLGASTKLDIAVLYRNFSRNFYSFYSNAFAENSITQNEKGIYWGWKYRFNHRLGLSGYVDFFDFPWLKYRGYSPSDGHEWLLRCSYQPTKKVLMFVQVREESRHRNTGENTITFPTNQGQKVNYWIGLEYGLRQKLKMKTRAQFSRYKFNAQTSRGMTLLQDISANIGKIQLTARYAITDTDDYDNRQYVYENDVWLAYSMPAYSGVSTRRMLLIEYKVNRFLSLWLRFASTRFPDEEKIGSGPDTINTNIKNDVKFQLRITF